VDFLYLNAGGFVSNGWSIAFAKGVVCNNGSTPASINIANSNIIISVNSVAYGWQAQAAGLTSVVTTGSTIAYTGTTGDSRFIGGTWTYNNIQIAPGSGALTFSGAFSFANMTMSSAGTKTVKFTKSTTYTMTGTSFLNGSGSGAITIDSNDGATQFTLTKASGNVVGDYLNVSRANVTGGAHWFLTANSTPFPDPNISGNTGWSTDTTPPTNPTTTTATVGGTSVTSGSWTNSASSPAFTFSGATDTETGLAGYYTYWDTSDTGDPTTYQAHVGADADNQYYNPAGQTDGSHYYFRIKTKDKANNTSTAGAMFDLKYDRTAPTRPVSITADPAGYTTNNSYSFSWPDGTDPNGPGGSASGIKWYEYKRATDAAWSHTANAADKSIGSQTAYQEGANVFYVRSVDNADNPSTTYAQVTYYWSGAAPLKPDNVTTAPVSSETNSFTICWDKPVQDPSASPIVGYRYSINEPPTATNTTYKASTAAHTCVGPDAFATQQGENTVYVISQDEIGHTSYLPAYYSTAVFSCATAAPPTPTSVSIYDTSDKVFSRWMLTIQWSAGSNQNSATFTHYSLERSLNGSIYTELTQTTNTSYIDSANLNDSTTYYYRLRAVDNAGKTSAYSTVVSAKPSGKYTTPPAIISAPSVSEITPDSAKISWATERNTSSYVRYGKTDGSFTDSTGEVDAVAAHVVSLPGLTPSTIYYFQVQSLDSARDYSPDTAYSTTYSFTTGAAPAISDVSVANVTLDAADVSWKTTTVSVSKINYGQDTSYGKEIEDISGAQTTQHSVKVSDLSNDTTYHFKIFATDISSNNLSSDDYSFKTLALPRIDSLKVEPVVDAPSQTVKVTWETNVETSTDVVYSASGIAAKQKNQAKLETGHAVEIDNLADSSTYTIVASGRDKFGNTATSEPKTYETLLDTRPAKITDIATESSNVGLGQRETAQVVISWKTDEPATSMVVYGEGISGETTQKTPEDTSLKTAHMVVISNLKPSVVYHFKTISKDRGGNISESGDNVIIAGEVRKSTFKAIMDALSNIFSWVGKK